MLKYCLFYLKGSPCKIYFDFLLLLSSYSLLLVALKRSLQRNKRQPYMNNKMYKSILCIT